MYEKTDLTPCRKCGVSKEPSEYSMYEKDTIPPTQRLRDGTVINWLDKITKWPKTLEAQPPTCNSCCRANQYKTLWSEPEVIPTKECRTCNISKPATDFYDRKESKDGKHSSCKDCMTAKAKGNKLAA